MIINKLQRGTLSLRRTASRCVALEAPLAGECCSVCGYNIRALITLDAQYATAYQCDPVVPVWMLGRQMVYRRNIACISQYLFNFIPS